MQGCANQLISYTPRRGRLHTRSGLYLRNILTYANTQQYNKHTKWLPTFRTNRKRQSIVTSQWNYIGQRPILTNWTLGQNVTWLRTNTILSRQSQLLSRVPTEAQSGRLLSRLIKLFIKKKMFVFKIDLNKNISIVYLITALYINNSLYTGYLIISKTVSSKSSLLLSRYCTF